MMLPMVCNVKIFEYKLLMVVTLPLFVFLDRIIRLFLFFATIFPLSPSLTHLHRYIYIFPVLTSLPRPINQSQYFDIYCGTHRQRTFYDARFTCSKTLHCALQKRQNEYEKLKEREKSMRLIASWYSK